MSTRTWLIACVTEQFSAAKADVDMVATHAKNRAMRCIGRLSTFTNTRCLVPGSRDATLTREGEESLWKAVCTVDIRGQEGVPSYVARLLSTNNRFVHHAGAGGFDRSGIAPKAYSRHRCNRNFMAYLEPGTQ